MTDRAQPGAIKSLARNDELAQLFGQLSNGWIVPGSQPTRAAKRRSDIDEAALDAFDLSTSSSSLTVTIAPGEAFVDGWLCRDVSTDLDLPSDSTVEIVVGWDPDVVYDPDVHADRDDADRVIVDLAANVPDEYPSLVIWEISTDANGVVDVTDRRQIGGSIDVDSASVDTLEASGIIGNGVYATPDDIPAEYEEEGKMAYTQSDGLVVFE